MQWAWPNRNLVENVATAFSKVGLAIYHSGEKLSEKEEGGLQVGVLQTHQHLNSYRGHFCALSLILSVHLWDGYQFLEHSGHFHLKGMQNQLCCCRPGLPRRWERKQVKVPSVLGSSPMAPVQLSTRREWESMKCPSLPPLTGQFCNSFSMVPPRNSSDIGIHVFTAVTVCLSVCLSLSLSPGFSSLASLSCSLTPTS